MNKKKIYLIFAILLLVMVIGISSAYLISSNTKVNNFKIASNESEIKEVFEIPENVDKGDEVIKDVKVKNIGDRSYIRMYVAIANSDVEKLITINFNSKDWTLDSDGYYYYNKPVNKGESTTSLFNKVIFKEKVDLNELKIICYSESVQAQGYNSAKSAFNSIR